MKFLSANITYSGAKTVERIGSIFYFTTETGRTYSFTNVWEYLGFLDFWDSLK
jgi:hypothetical protein